MKKIFLSIILGVSITYAYSQEQVKEATKNGAQLLAASTLKDKAPVKDTATKAKDTTVKKPEPFAFGDFTWLNGNDRKHTALLDSKYFTGRVLLDFNYTVSNNNPIDHTVVGSTALPQ